MIPLTAALAIAVTALPVVAPAQSADQTETISGRVASIDDSGNMDVNDDRGYIDSVQLRQGTVINPPGTRLMPGMVIRILGVNRGNVFAANKVDIAQQSLPQYAPPPQQPQQQPQPDAPARMPRATQPLPADVLPPQLAQAGDFTGSIGTPLDSKDAYVGQSVELNDVSSSDGSIRHASMDGTVSSVTRPGQGHTAQIEIQFNHLHLRNGTSYRVVGVVTNMTVSTKSNALKEVGGALAGMLIGNAIGKTVFGVSGGGIAGALGGFLVAKDNRSDVQIPENAAITVRLVKARRQAT
jgi:hypothetical protein